MSKKFNTIKNIGHIVAQSEGYIPRSMTNFLDYTFMSHRNKLSFTSFNINLDNFRPKNYLFDLIQTFELNADLLSEILKKINDEKENNEIMSIYNKMRNDYHKKKELRKKVKDYKSKILIESQIYSEAKRKNEENAEYYKDQIRDNEDNCFSKEEYIKIFQKKLKEVEIYIHKNIKDDTQEKYKKYQLWKMIDFLEESDYINKKKEDLKKDINKIIVDIKNVKNENKIFFEENIRLEKNKKKIISEEEKQINIFMKKYKNQIRIITMRIKLLKNYLNNINKTLNYLNFERKQISKEKNEEEEYLVTEEPEKSQLPLDISKKINNYMDFSIVLNGKQNDESKISELGKTSTFNQGNISNINMWDISMINKNNN